MANFVIKLNLTSFVVTDISSLPVMLKHRNVLTSQHCRIGCHFSGELAHKNVGCGSGIIAQMMNMHIILIAAKIPTVCSSIFN